jgi:starch phosphorylase
VSDTYRRPEESAKKSILNTARMEKFSTDRTIKEYAKAIWGLKPVQLEPL